MAASFHAIYFIYTSFLKRILFMSSNCMIRCRPLLQALKQDCERISSQLSFDLRNHDLIVGLYDVNLKMRQLALTPY